MLKYKGYIGTVEYDDCAKIFSGYVDHMLDIITFQGETVEELNNAFKDSIDDYIEFCNESGKVPEKQFSGNILIKSTPELHHRIYKLAKTTGKSINNWLTDTLENMTNNLEIKQFSVMGK